MAGSIVTDLLDNKKQDTDIIFDAVAKGGAQWLTSGYGLFPWAINASGIPGMSLAGQFLTYVGYVHSFGGSALGAALSMLKDSCP